MSLRDDALARAKAVQAVDEQLKADEAERQRVWRAKYAADQLEKIKKEVPIQVMEAANKGETGTSISVYSWSSDGRPDWFTYEAFRKPLEAFFASENLGYNLREGGGRSRDVDMPDDYWGSYKIWWD